MNRYDLAEFFADVVVVEPKGCWIFQQERGRGCYKAFRSRPAHRFAYEQWIGRIPRRFVIDHLCREKSCVNPVHLEVVTRGENTRRGNRGRGIGMERRNRVVAVCLTDREVERFDRERGGVPLSTWIRIRACGNRNAIRIHS